MLNIKNVKMMIITFVCVLCCLRLTNKVQASEIINKYINSTCDIVTIYNDESFSVVNTNTDTYEFTTPEIGDWNYTCENLQELNKLIESYNSCKDTYNKCTGLYVTNQYTKADGSIVTEYNDGTWSIENSSVNLYEVYFPITEDWTLEFNNADDMHKCINTYKSILENGYY